MRVVVAGKSGKTMKMSIRMMCVVLMNTAYFSGSVPKLIKSLKKKFPQPPSVSRNIEKSALFKTMTCEKMSHSVE